MNLRWKETTVSTRSDSASPEKAESDATAKVVVSFSNTGVQFVALLDDGARQVYARVLVHSPRRVAVREESR